MKVGLGKAPKDNDFWLRFPGPGNLDWEPHRLRVIFRPLATRSSSPIEEAEALLRRGSSVTSEQLVKLIHEVNPTTRGLRNSDRNRRYALKARLQSLLIRRFPDQIRVVPGETAGVVSLLHRYVGLDACHAVLDELEDDARSWVTYQLDIGPETETRPTATNPSSTRPLRGAHDAMVGGEAVAALVSAGEQALAEYDFEQAASHFERALQASNGAIEPARALLGLWVDQLGADDAALELESRLPKTTLANAEIRALLATAAARVNDVKRAERLARGLDGSRAAEIMAMCARAALNAADPDSASLWMAQLRELDSMHPMLLECERELQRLQDEERKVAEAELQRLLTEGTIDGAERCAIDLLRRWPHSAIAASWLHQMASDRAKSAALRALEQAEREQMSGAPREASMILRIALVPELDSELKLVLEHKIAELDRQLREVADRQRVGDVATTFGSVFGACATQALKDSRTESALNAYFELPAELRASVREIMGRSELEWVDPILAKLGVRRAKHAALAVLLLIELQSELEQNPTETLVRLQPYAEALESMAQSSRLLAKARRAARLERQSVAAEQLRQAEQELAKTNCAEALSLLESIVADDLNPNDNERRRELLASTRHTMRQQELEFQFALLCRQGELFRARDFAARHAERTQAEEQVAWQARRNELQTEIAHAWCWKTGTGSIGNFWPHAISASIYLQAAEPWVEVGGNTAILSIVVGRWLLILRYRLETAEVQSWVRMLLPESTMRVELARVTEDVAVFVTEQSALLQIDIRNWQILSFHGGPRSTDWRPEECVVSRDARWLWQVLDRDQDSDWQRKIQVIDLGTHRVVREFDDVEGLFPIMGSQDMEMGIRRQGCVSFHRPKGAALSGLAIDLSFAVVVQAPSGNGLIGAYADDDHDTALVLVGPMRQGRIPEELVLEGSSGESNHQLAAALDRGVVVARYHADDGQWLEAFEESGDRLVSLYRVSISASALLLTDRASRRVWVLDVERGMLIAREIGREPQSLLFNRAPRRHLGESTLGLWECSHGRRESEARVPLDLLDTTQSAWQLAEAAQNTGPGQLVPMLNAAEQLLYAGGLYQMGSILQLALTWAFPNDSNALLRAADEHADLDEWAEAHRCLRSLKVEELPPNRQRHALHLLALCSLMGRDYSKVHEYCQRAAVIDGPCDLSFLDQHTQPIDEVLDEQGVVAEREDAGGGDPAIIALRRALRDADALLAADDPRAAFQAAAIPELFFWADEQLLACAAEALMQFEPRDTAERLRRECVFAALLAVETAHVVLRPITSIPEAWDDSRIDRIRSRAARQFEVDTGAVSLKSPRSVVPIGPAQGAAHDPRSFAWPPPLGHERLLELHPGLSRGIDSLLAELIADLAGSPIRGLSEAELLADPRLWRIVEAERARLSKEEMPSTTAVYRLAKLGPHLGYLVNQSLAGRTSYWVDGELARMLREPLPSSRAITLAVNPVCQCFAFTDHDTLQTATKLLARDRYCEMAKKPITSLTAYVWRSGTNPSVSRLSMRLVFIPEERLLPYLIARELRIDPASDFDAIVNSHCTDKLEAALDPIVASPKFLILLRMVLGAIMSVTDPNVEVRELGDCPFKEPKRQSPSTPVGATTRQGWIQMYSQDSLRLLGCRRRSEMGES